MDTKFASFPIARSSSPSNVSNTFSVTAPTSVGTGGVPAANVTANGNLLVLDSDPTRAYAILRNNSSFQIAYGYNDSIDLINEGMVLNPSDTAVLDGKGQIYIKGTNDTQPSNVRVDVGES